MSGRGRVRVFASLAAALSLAAGPGVVPRAPAQGADPLVYFCPMHPEVTEARPGACPKCGMALVPGRPWDDREYAVELRLRPAAARPGEPVELRFRVSDPETGATVQDFEVVHGKRYHLFVASQDLEHFEHVHPEQQPDGTWAIELRLRRPGYYRAYSDFLPRGGAPQVVARTFATAGFDGDLPSSVGRLVPDARLVKTVGGTTVRLTPDPEIIVAGRMQRLRYRLESGGAPVTDLEPYLAAWGHTLVLSEDALEYVHAHPIEYLPPEAVDPRAGPDLTFDALFPRPGRYRVWTQFKRGDEVSTVSFTVEAVPPPS